METSLPALLLKVFLLTRWLLCVHPAQGTCRPF
uniref:Uncharacterized protein n=1 Tax=Anguilla anguilla TaxID=7936 RepID=A0A0E9TPE7_ANGAN